MGDALLQYFALWPWGPDQIFQTAQGLVSIGFRPWQIVTYAFMHGGLTHIAFNMIALYMFGGTIERTVRRAQFHHLLLRLRDRGGAGPVDGGALVHARLLDPTLGASGAIFGLLLAFGMMYPHEKVMLIFLPVPMPAWLFVIGYGRRGAVLGRDRDRMPAWRISPTWAACSAASC